MKRFFYFLLCLTFCSCNQEDSFETPATKQLTEEDAHLSAIKSYIALTRNDVNTRAGNNELEITPYIFEGDTTLYVVNYNPGWQVFSNSEISPLVLACSNSGTLNIESEVQDVQEKKMNKIERNTIK